MKTLAEWRKNLEEMRAKRRALLGWPDPAPEPEPAAAERRTTKRDLFAAAYGSRSAQDAEALIRQHVARLAMGEMYKSFTPRCRNCGTSLAEEKPKDQTGQVCDGCLIAIQKMVDLVPELVGAALAVKRLQGKMGTAIHEGIVLHDGSIPIKKTP